MRLAQHTECRAVLLSAKLVDAAIEAWNTSHGSTLVDGRVPMALGAFDAEGQRVLTGPAVLTKVATRLDLVACILFSFLSESDDQLHTLVPPEAVVHFAEALDARLALTPGPTEASQQVEQGLFFGLPLYGCVYN